MHALRLALRHPAPGHVARSVVACCALREHPRLQPRAHVATLAAGAGAPDVAAPVLPPVLQTHLDNVPLGDMWPYQLSELVLQNIHEGLGTSWYTVRPARLSGPL